MRSREEITETLRQHGPMVTVPKDFEFLGMLSQAVLEVLLDIRDLLQPISIEATSSKQVREMVLDKLKNDPPFPRSDA